MARVIKEAVSDAISHHLSDPRIEGFVSVVRVDMPADLRRADVYLSILGKSKDRTFAAIQHAHSRIQAILAERLHSKFCPTLHFHQDEKLKKTLETMRIIAEAAKTFKKTDEEQTQENG